ncbi:HlyD family efflux transporter periplasmic adaptor subunit [Novosphingobium sp.]|uniref:HlyD family secretion protein n=1 Tax=Novosphingobium sp. TaxID=1874826 RepID=UPI00260ECA28|nr:HlyD family efflux transporter periplasmic adaptor subunit [Novosphingobium sp.]
MIQERLFRQEVIEAGRNRLAGTVIAAVPPTSRHYTRLVVFAALGFLLILTLGSYASTATVRGVVAYDAGVARIYPRDPAEVVAVHVRIGQRVTAGQPIATLSVAQGQGGVAPQLDQMDRQNTELGRQIELTTAQTTSTIAALELQHAGIAATIASLSRQQRIAAEQVNIAESAVRRAERLARDGAGTQRQIEDSRSALLARRAEAEALGEQVIAQRNQLTANAAERGRLRLEAARSQSVLLGQRASLSEQKAALARRGQLVLTAPVDGVVGDLGVEIGQLARPERTVASIIPEGSAQEIWLYAPSRAVGSARLQQLVRLQFDAFPFEKYGSGTGVVTEISQVATDPANVDPGLGVTEPVFRIRVQIKAVSQRAEFTAASLRPGMTLTGKLQLERHNLWQVFLGPVFEAFS